MQSCILARSKNPDQPTYNAYPRFRAWDQIMSKSLLLVFLIFIITIAVSAQTGTENCPTLSLSGPIAAVKDGDSAVFSITVTGKVDQNKLSFKWNIENGTINAGAGTREITVTVSGKTKATVDVGGIDEVCGKTASMVVKYGNVKPSPMLFDEFGKVKNSLLQKRLTALGQTLEQNSGAKAYFVNYGSDQDIEKREASIRSMFGANAARAVFVKGGVEKEVRTRVWIVPYGAETTGLN